MVIYSWESRKPAIAYAINNLGASNASRNYKVRAQKGIEFQGAEGAEKRKEMPDDDDL